MIEMEYHQRKQVFFFVLVVFILATSFSVYCLVLKRDALQFDDVDYNYFIEQAARLTDLRLSNRFTLNIEGYNMLGLQGIEGVRNLYHAIHAEYFRYVYVLIYGVFHNTLLLYIFYSVFFFLPVIYFALVATTKKVAAGKQVVLFTALYVLFPATFNSVTEDLRPRILFASAWCLAVLAVYYERSFPEKLLTFCLLPAIREEGILLGVVIIVLNFVRMQGKPGRWLQTLVLLSLDAAALVSFLAFMSWGRFKRVDIAYDPRQLLVEFSSTSLLPVLGLVLLVVLLAGYFWFKKRPHFKILLMLLVYSLAIALTGFQAARVILSWFPDPSQVWSVKPWDLYLAFVSSPSIALVIYITILLLVLMWDFTRGTTRTLFSVFLILLCIIFVATTLSYFPARVASWWGDLSAARLIWDFTRDHDRYATNVLVDYDTYQAFYNYENILVYNRLPLWLSPPYKRFYPANQDIVARQIKKRMEYAVIAQASLDDVHELAHLAGISVEEVAFNRLYVVLKFGVEP